MTSIRTGLAIQFLASNSSTLIMFGLSIILARLLTPAEIGVYSMTAVVINFAHVFRDFGVGNYVRSCRELDNLALRSAFGVLILTSWSFAAIIFLSRGVITDYYSQPAVSEIIAVLSMGFLLVPFGAIVQARLGREMQAGKQAFVTLASNIVYFIASIVLALAGFGYMTMAWAALINISASALLFNLVRPRGMPWLPSLAKWREVTSFGVGSLLTSALKAVDQAFADLYLGRASSPHSVGIYSRANSTANIVNQVGSPTIEYFALPYLAQVHREGGDINWSIMRAVNYLTGLIWPALSFVALFSPEIIGFLYGDAWLECVPVVPWLCLALAVKLPFVMVHNALIGTGRPYWPAVPMLAGLLGKLGIVLVIFDGTLVSFGMGVAAGEILSVPIELYLARQKLGIPLREWRKALALGMLVSLPLLLALILANLLISGLSSLFLRLLLDSAVAAIVWIGVLHLIKHPLMLELSRVRSRFQRS